MISQEDLFVLQHGIERGKLTIKQGKQLLLQASSHTASLSQILHHHKIISQDEWKKLHLNFQPHLQKINQELSKRLAGSAEGQLAKKLPSLVSEATKRQVSLLSLLLLNQALSPHDLKNKLDILLQVPLACSSCQYQIQFWEYLPFDSHHCPLCQREFQKISPATDSTSQTDTSLLNDHLTRPMAKPAGALVADFGKYQILNKLGEGGMGAVYKALDSNLGRVVALKIISSPDITPEQLERFEREMRLLASLQHPYIIPLYEWNQIDGKLYFTMAYVQGMDLDGYVKERGPLSLKEALSILQKITQAVVEVHLKGIIHRDIKPGNIMMGDDDSIYLMDFGLARQTRSAKASLTQTGSIVGSPQYMAPEQALGDRDLDGRTDIYALGGVLFFMLTGRPPFEDDEILRLLQRLVREDPPPLRSLRSGLGREIEVVVQTCLEKDRSRRYPQGEILLGDIQAILSQGLLWARGPSFLRKGSKWLRKHVIGIFLSLVILLVIAGGLSFWANRGNENQLIQINIEKQKNKKARSLLQKGIDLLNNKKNSQAISYLNQSIALNPHQSLAYLYRGIADYITKKYKKALLDLTRAIQRDPQDRGGYYFRGLCYLMLKKPQKAILDFDQALLISPQYGPSYYNRGSAYLDLKYYKKAILDFDQAISFQIIGWQVYYDRGRCYKGLGQYERALADFKKARVFSPKNSQIYTQIGLCYDDMGKHRQALLNHKKALQINPKSWQIHYNLGLTYQGLRKPKLSILEFNKAQALHPDFWELYRGRGISYLLVRNLKKALQDFDRGLKINPKAADLYNGRGICYKELHKLQRALKNCNQAIFLDPRNPKYYFNRGTLYRSKHQLSKSLKDLNKAISLAPNLVPALCFQGIVLVEMGRKKEGIVALKKAFSLQPGSAYGKRARQELEKLGE